MWSSLEGRWLARHDLSAALTGGGFWRAYFGHPAIRLYLALVVVCLGLAVALGARPISYAILFVYVLAGYPWVEYLLHRTAFHDLRYCRSRLGSRFWKRVHFDHHRDPNDYSVLFGAPYMAIPTIAVITAPVGWLIDGGAGAGVAFAAGMVAICVYEWAHAMCHVNWPVRRRWLRSLRRAHLLHHFHSEKANYGIATRLVDRVIGTIYDSRGDVDASPTVRNLGYTREVAKRYPWVAAMTEDWGRAPADE